MFPHDYKKVCSNNIKIPSMVCMVANCDKLHATDLFYKAELIHIMFWAILLSEVGFILCTHNNSLAICGLTVFGNFIPIEQSDLIC